MELTHLKTFLTVARKGNLSAAAKELGATQPNLGRQMTALSKEVGMDLFVRHSRGVELTQKGKEFFELCQRIVGELDQETALIRESGIEPEGPLKVVAGTNLLEKILQKLPEFSSRYPKIKFYFSSSADIFHFQIGNADVGVTPVFFSDPNLIQVHLYDIHLRIFASPDYLKKHPYPKTFQDLKSHNVIVYIDDDNNISRLLNIQEVENQSDNSYGEPFMQVNSGIAMRSALLRGLGIGTFLYERDLVENNLMIDVFPDLQDHKVPYYYTYHKRLEGSPKVQVFYEFIKDVVKVWDRPSNT